MTGSHYEISAREREDEQRRHYYEFDHRDETYDEYLARLSQRPEADESSSSTTGGASHVGTGRSESRDNREAA